jgi:hypothetical protein
MNGKEFQWNEKEKDIFELLKKKVTKTSVFMSVDCMKVSQVDGGEENWILDLC